MHPHLRRCFLFVSATLFLSLASLPQLARTPLEIVAASAQAPTNQNQQSIEAVQLYLIGVKRLDKGQFREAIETFQQVLGIFKAIGERQGEVATLNSLGDAYTSLGQNSQALKFYDQALVVYQEMGDKPGEATALNNLGLFHYSLGQHPQALKFLQQALMIRQQQQDKAGEATTLNNLGQVYDNTSQYLQALQFHQQALVIRRALKDKAGENASLISIGQIYDKLGQYPAALKFLQQALVLAREVSDRKGEGATLNNLGSVHHSLGQYSQALQIYEQALAVSKAVGDREGEGKILNNLGLVYSNQEQYPQALQLYEQVLAIVQKLGDKEGEARTFNNIGSIYHSLGQNSQSLKFYEQALDIVKAVGNQAGAGVILNNIGLVHDSLGQYSQALQCYEQALVILRKAGDKAGEGKILHNIGAEHVSLGQYADAEKKLLAAIQILESLRSGLTDGNKISIFETQADTYRLLQKNLIAQNKTDAALEIAERGRARAFVELLAARSSQANSALGVIAPPNIQKIKQIAKEQKATLVEYSIALDALYVWVVKPEGKVTFRRVDLKNVDLLDVAERSRVAAATGSIRGVQEDEVVAELVRGTRVALGATGHDAINSATSALLTSTPSRNNRRLKQMYELLIKPIADLLPTEPKSRVIFIPHKALFLVPFAALQDREGKYLIEKHTLLIAPSIQVLDLTHQQRQKLQQAAPQNAVVIGIPRSAVVVGNPQMPSVSPGIGEPAQPLKPLPGAEAEAKAIATLLSTQAITGNRATKAAVLHQLSEARIIHLATHGLLADIGGLGEPGAIALAPSSNDSGLLTASEILNLKLKAELVVLSACDTGRGRVTGDGVVGLSRAFISAGTPSVIVSLWRVSDESTAFLMPEFYRQLSSNPDKAQALRQAMLSTMKKYPNPSDWAAFTLIGEAE